MVDLNSPQLKLGEMTGTISAYDEVLEKISVQGARGMNMEFIVDTNTPITDHNQQIGFADLHVGDQVTVHYNVDPQQVNSIEKI